MNRPITTSTFLLTFATVACTGSANLGGSGPGGNDSGSGDPPSPKGDAASVQPGTPSLPPATPIAPGGLEGVWEINGSRPGAKPVVGTLELRSNLFAIAFPPYKLTMTLAPDGSADGQYFGNDSNRTAIVTTHSAATQDSGAIPFPFGGSWSFRSSVASDDTLCTGALGATDLSAGCNSSVHGRPGVLPRLDGMTHATKVTTLPSSFGDLGGRWAVGSTSKCSATFEQNTVTWQCPPGNDQWSGKATITFTSTTASGSAGNGIQFSALKQ